MPADVAAAVRRTVGHQTEDAVSAAQPSPVDSPAATIEHNHLIRRLAGFGQPGPRGCLGFGDNLRLLKAGRQRRLPEQPLLVGPKQRRGCERSAPWRAPAEMRDLLAGALSEVGQKTGKQRRRGLAAGVGAHLRAGQVALERDEDTGGILGQHVLGVVAPERRPVAGRQVE